MKPLKKITSFVCLLNIFALMLINSAQAQTTYSFPTDKEIAVWEWRTPSNFSDATMRNQYLAKLKSEGVNTVYINIKNFIEVYYSSVDRDKKIANFNRQSADFIRSAQSYGIKVHALAGAADWAKPEKSNSLFIILNHILDYNYKNTYKYAGINFDVEYYTLWDYPYEMNTYSQQYLNLVDKIITTIQSSQHHYMTLGLTIPFWIEKVNSNNPSIYYKGLWAPTGIHLMNLLNRHGRTYLSIMAYRNYYDGVDGTINLVKDELEYLKSKNYKTKVVVGQETHNITPTYITFYSKTRQSLKYSSTKIDEAYQWNANFAGIGIHNGDTYLDLNP
jgi:hypothetical protein